MGHRITLDVARLDAYYEKMMDEVYLMHHTYPSNLPHYNLTAEDLAEMQTYNALGRAAIAGLAENRKFLPSNATLDYEDGRWKVTFWRDGKPIKKKTYFEFDPNYSNGIPVRAIASRKSGSDVGCVVVLVAVTLVYLALLVWVMM